LHHLRASILGTLGKGLQLLLAQRYLGGGLHA
jgi:hypothetical protein